jgi:hypothetical protein
VAVRNPPAPPPPAAFTAPLPPPATTKYSTCVAPAGAVQVPDVKKYAILASVGVVGAKVPEDVKIWATYPFAEVTVPPVKY